MAITTISSLTTTLNWTQTDAASGSNARDVVTVESKENLTNGTGTGQSNTVWFGSGTLNSGSNTTFDLYDLTRSIFGATLTTSFASGNIKLLSVKNTSVGSGQSLFVDNSLTNGFTRYSTGDAIIKVPPGSSFTISNNEGYDTSLANRYIRLVDDGQAASYEIGIVGSVL